MSKLKYFGHIMHSSDSLKKCMKLGLTDGSRILRKRVYNIISRNMRNCDNELVQHLNPLEHTVVSDATGLAIRFNTHSSARRLRHRCRLLVILAFCQ